jgi:macrolide transport system ATP-binding/permease protein
VLSPGGAGIQDMQERYASNLNLLMWVSGLVLLIACANIANLLVVRGMGRKAEIAVRTALGAMRVRIIQQLLTESVILAGLSGAVGLLVAYAGTRMLLLMAFPGAQSIPIHASPSLAVIGFAFGLSLLTGVLFGVAPAWIAARTEPVEALRKGTRTATAGSSFLQRSLVVSQAALSLVLLAGAGLFSQSLNKIESTDLKLESKNRYIVHIDSQAAGYLPTQLEALYGTIEQRFHELPGVRKVGISTNTLMENSNSSRYVQVQGQPNLNIGASYVGVNAEYFDSVGTHVVKGRGIRVDDTLAALPVAVVNRTFVRDFLKPGENPIGHRFGFPGPNSTGDYEIVGVVEDTVYTSVQWKDHRMYFVPMMKRPVKTTQPIENDESLYAEAIVLETDRPINNLERLARGTLASINPNLTLVKLQTFGAQIADRFTEERMIARLTMLFGALALLLATIGLYGVTSYTVAQRTAEIGIRMALGAPRIHVTAMVVKGAMAQTAMGLLIGIPVALVCSRFVQAQLYEVTGINTDVLMTAVLTLATAALVAGLIPARRAASIDPARALRAE